MQVELTMIPDFDSVIAVFAVGVAACLAFHLGRLSNSRVQAPLWLTFASLLSSLFFCQFLSGQLFWAKYLPVSEALVWCNLAPLLIGFSAGCFSSLEQVRARSRGFATAAFSFLGILFLTLPFIRPMLFPANVDLAASQKEDLFLQTHESTCAAASAATLLKMHGIAETEQSMVRKCLTSNQGTEALGLFRGLKRATRESNKSARVGSSNPMDWILKSQLPNVALVNFDENEFAADGRHSLKRPSRFLGLSDAQGHAVVVLDHHAGNWLIGDPAVGMVVWSDEELNNRFTGDSIYLSKR